MLFLGMLAMSSSLMGDFPSVGNSSSQGSEYFTWFSALPLIKNQFACEFRDGLPFRYNWAGTKVKY